MRRRRKRSAEIKVGISFEVVSAEMAEIDKSKLRNILIALLIGIFGSLIATAVWAMLGL